MKHILVLNYEFPPVGGGGGTSTKNLSAALVAKGLKITIITSWINGLKKREFIDGYEVRRYFCLRSKPDRCSLLEMFFSIIFMTFPALVYCIKQKPDLIHCNFAVPTGVVAYICNKITGIPYVLTVHGGDVPSFNKLFVSQQFYNFSQLIKPLTMCIWRNARAVICSSSYFHDLIKEEYLFVEPVTIPFGVDLKFFYPKEKLVSDKLSLVFFSRLTKQKGLLKLLDSLPSLDINQNWELKIIGDGPERQEIEEKIKKYNLQQKVTLCGWQDREIIRKTLWDSTAFVLPSLQESFGLVALEAIACGTPALVSDIPVLKELVENTGFGVVVKDWNKDLWPSIKLAQTLKLDESKLAEYSWANTAEKYYEEFEKSFI